MQKRHILKLCDRYGWAFYFTTIEQMRYTKHDITCLDWNDFLKEFSTLDKYDIIYFPSPLMCQNEVNKKILEIKNNPKNKNIKIIGAYSGLIHRKYDYADLIISISLSDLNNLKNESLFPVIFLPESIDTNMFSYINVPMEVDKWNIPHLNIGWAGKYAPDKRAYLLDDLRLEVKHQCKHGKQYFKKDKSQQEMVDFYHSIDCLMLPSSHECMPRVVLEAMSTGIPVIATNVGSIPWLLQKDMIVDAQSEEQTIKQMNQKLKMLLDNPSLKKEIGERNRQWIDEKFSWEKNQVLWDEIFDLLCDKNFEKINSISNNYITKLNQSVSSITPINTSNKLKVNVLKVIDSYGWAYDFIYKDQREYTKNRLSRITLPELHRLPYLNDIDIVYFSGANLGETKTLTKKFKKQNAKIIGAYSGENLDMYQENDIDIIVSISYPFTEQLKSMYPNKPVIFMPEGINTSFFTYNEPNLNSFNVGWAGRQMPVKRPHLLNQFKYPIKIQSNHSEKDLNVNATLEPMKHFYKDIDVLILPSKSECMPRVVLEAMSSGLPVIATNVGSISFLLDSEWIVPNTNDKDIIQNINMKLDILKNNPQLRKQVGLRNRKHIESFFDWNILMPMWDNLFQYLYDNNISAIYNISNTWANKIQELEKEIIQTPAQNITKQLSLEETLLILLKSKYEFWLINNTCFEAIKYYELKSWPIEIGVRNYEVKKQIEDLNLDNIVIKIIPIQKLKKYHVFKRETNVPCPVVDYLENIYHKPFNEIIK
jgi:glycosyltransferase involved in cell wall biosynthesis